MQPNSVFIPGHFGEFLQGRMGPDGPVALITIPCADVGVWAHHRPGRGLHLSGQVLPLSLARRVLLDLGVALRGHVRLRPVCPPALGTGVSTAALLALAHLAAGAAPTPHALARACVRAEGASDPLMYRRGDRILWASRRGDILAHLPLVPRYEVIGGFYGPRLRTRADDMAFPQIADLVRQWGQAHELAQFAALASESARRTLCLRGPADDPTQAVAQRLGALGFCISHTGAARGLIFAPGTVPAGAAAALLAAGLRGIRRFQGGGA
ncbi:hypothetical protein BFP70_07595 [Thioclava sp. SK-1]|uniref:hypothetical protein n=1 Tax=Thioclava sp. SK-1 TaxID=1889770 RepID=UPI0008270704|nr:hypothetical protein [Thioclava sp. SK-1]OCX65978.1 hypothetical protein BFP70_07595 [Thioclava sp. SK-1]